MSVGNVLYTPKKALYQTDIVDNLLSAAPNLPLSAAQGKTLHENMTGFLSLKQDYTRSEIKLEGDKEQYYPVTFPFASERINTIEIERAIHADGNNYGSLRFMALFGSNAWGVYPPFIKVVANLFKEKSFVARCRYGSGGVYNALIWLRGGCTYTIYTNTKSTELAVYYEKTNLGTHPNYPCWVEPLTEVDAGLAINTVLGEPYNG